MDEPSFDSLTTDQMLFVNRCCDKFEQIWKSNLKASIIEYSGSIGNTDTETYLILAKELVSLDIQYRTANRISITQETYLTAFPVLSQSDIDAIKSTDDQEPPLFLPGQRFGEYVIEQVASKGGMGQVYRAYHELMGRNVAIKVLLQHVEHDAVARRRFEREVQLLASLSHPNIVAAYDAREIDGRLCLVTEWIGGQTLTEKVRVDGPLPIDDAIEIGIQAARGLGFAHNAGLVHRDVKPSNLITDITGRVKILDLGLAKYSLGDESTSNDTLTASHHVMGTAEFLAPEQARSPARASVQNDIYSLGCTLFFLIVGRPPYSGDSSFDTLIKHASDQTPTLSQATTRTVPKSIETLIRRMMDKNPENRPKSMEEVADQLGHCLCSPSNASMPMDYMSRMKMARYALCACGAFLVFTAIWFCTQEFGLSNATAETGKNRGLSFNGTTSYAVIEDFDVPPSGHAMIEALVTPRHGQVPANIVTWTGNESLVLFTSNDGRWGVAALYRGESILRVANPDVQFGKTYLVAAKQNGRDLELWINGEPIRSHPIEYNLGPTEPTLCFGGLPSGLFPSQEGTRFFAGTIHRVRLSAGPVLSPASAASELTQDESTVCLLDFHEQQGSITTDLTAKKWEAKLIEASWLD